MGFKCLLLVFGTFLSYETRNLKLRFINDSRFVGLAIYNVAVMTLVTAPVVTLLIHGKVDANFAFISLTGSCNTNELAVSIFSKNKEKNF